MKQIPLTGANGGLVALVSDEDYPRLSQHAWRAHKSKEGRHYASRKVPSTPCANCGQSKSVQIYMHREIFEHTLSDAQTLASDTLVDHKDGNTMNNQRENLRAATHCENAWNCAPATDGFKGVTETRDGRFVARVQHKDQRYYLGRHDTAEDAAHAYDEKARELFGEFARLNFPDSPF